MKSLHRKQWAYLPLIALYLFMPTLAHGVFVGPPQTSAGVVERQIEKEYEAKDIPPNRDIPLLESDIPDRQLNMSDKETAFVKNIRFKGNHAFSSKKLNKKIQQYLGRELSMREIQKMCLIIQKTYAKNGYFLARVFPPVQEVQNGQLWIEIIEGTLGNIAITGNKHYKEKFIRSYFERFIGKPINYNDILKALFLLNENSDLRGAIVFKKGETFGTADLILKIEDKSPRHLMFDQNNYGSHATTLWRTGARADLGNLFTQGDTFSIAEVVGNPVDHLNFSDGIYTIPLNRRGSFLSLSFLYSSFHVSRLNPLHLKGRSAIGTIQFKQALQRTRNLSTNLTVEFDVKQIRNYALGKTASYDRLRVLSLGYALDGSDFLKGRNIGDVSVSVGIPDIFDGSKAIDHKSSRRGAGGRFVILNLDYQRLQQLPLDCFIVLNASGQGTPYKLPLPQQIYIGGIDTVRGYAAATALGDNGYYTNFEFRFAPPFLRQTKVPFFKKKTFAEFLQFLYFVDHGQVFLNGGGEAQKHNISLTSTGLGARVYGPFNINFNFDVGFPLTKEKKTSTAVLYWKISWKLF